MRFDVGYNHWKMNKMNTLKAIDLQVRSKKNEIELGPQ